MTKSQFKFLHRVLRTFIKHVEKTTCEIPVSADKLLLHLKGSELGISSSELEKVVEIFCFRQRFTFDPLARKWELLLQRKKREEEQRLFEKKQRRKLANELILRERLQKQQREDRILLAVVIVLGFLSGLVIPYHDGLLLFISFLVPSAMTLYFLFLLPRIVRRIAYFVFYTKEDKKSCKCTHF